MPGLISFQHRCMVTVKFLGPDAAARRPQRLGTVIETGIA